MASIGLLFRRLTILALALFLPLAQAQAAGSILVWPIDPTIEHDQRATALWIENRGRERSLLQMRIFAWSQADGKDSYAEQHEIAGTPPMIQIEPGKRQMIRLTRLTPTPPGTERAFRVVIDEIPTQETAKASDGASIGIKFQLRYSIPLFVYGEGLWWKPRPDRQRDAATAGKPKLGWRISTQDGKPYLEVRNSGPVHARLTRAGFQQDGKTIGVTEGLLGYVLPGSIMRQPLPAGVHAPGAFTAVVNGGTEAHLIPAMQ